MNPVPIWVWLLLLGVAFAGGGAVGWLDADTRAKLEAATLELAHSRAYAQAMADANTRAASFETEAATVAQALKVTTDELETLRAGVAAGTVGVRVRATCPRLPPAGATVRTERPSAELDPVAQQDYFRLRAAIAVTEAQLTTCLAFARSVAN